MKATGICFALFHIQAIQCFTSSPAGCRHRHSRTRHTYSSSLILRDETKITELKCQLLGMNCATPTDFTFSWTGFSKRGGETDVHCHGWGIIFYEGRGIRAFHDSSPASSSPIAELVSRYPMRTLNMMAHIRYATQGEVCLENVHPFHREMWGIQWTFCHNGDVPLFKGTRDKKLPWLGSGGGEGERIYNPVGDTDSERMFCSILNALKVKFSTLPSLPVLHEYLRELLQEIVDHDQDGTILNCLLGCGQYIQFAYSWPGSRPGSNVWNGLHYVVREPPFKRAVLCDCDYEVDFSQLAGDDSRVAVITTKPLTLNEEWVEFERGQLILFDEGLPHLLPEDSLVSELSGHGLCSSCHPSSHPVARLEEDVRRFENKRSLLTFTGDGI
mmetsp:Transcript_5879/g.11122  ORF Transcript_5879/g.11122 Transcript_5879/m.11122 type:complete len:386 (-) Transcript_5879:2345-3502(-)